MTVSQLAKHLGVSRQDINGHLSKGHIRSIRVEMGKSHYRLIPIRELKKIEKWLRKKRPKNELDI